MHQLCNSGDLEQSNGEGGDEDHVDGDDDDEDLDVDLDLGFYTNSKNTILGS